MVISMQKKLQIKKHYMLSGFHGLIMKGKRDRNLELCCVVATTGSALVNPPFQELYSHPVKVSMQVYPPALPLPQESESQVLVTLPHQH